MPRNPNKTADFDRKLAEHMGAFFNDPYGFVMFTFPWGKAGTALEHYPDGPDQWQIDYFNHLAEMATRNLAFRDAGDDLELTQMAVASGHGIGKSTQVAWVILWLMSTRPDCRIVVTANTEAQLRTKTWPELSKWHNLAINKHWFTWTNTSFYYAFYPENQRKNYIADAIPWTEERSEGFAGLHNAASAVAVIVDEASAVPDKILEVAQGALTDGEPFLLAFGNPTRNTGWFFDAFHKDHAYWWTKSVDSREVRLTNKKYLNRLVEQYGEDSDYVRIRVRGLFPYGSEESFFQRADIQFAQERDLVEQEGDDFSPLIMGIDAAHMGSDSTVFAFRRGRDARSIRHEKYQQIRTEEIATRAAHAIDKYKPDHIVVEAVGPGYGVADMLKSRGYNVHMVFTGTPAAAKRQYANKRAEMYGRFRDWIMDYGCLPKDQELMDDLLNIQFEVKDNGGIQLEPKKNMRKRGLRSPDVADAYALTFVLRFNPERRRPQRRDYFGQPIGSRRQNIAIGADYDPFA